MENRKPPGLLFKYRSMAGSAKRFTEAIFSSHEIFFAPARTFNDPFESRFAFGSDFTDGTEASKSRATLWAMHRILRQDIGILSLSEVMNDILMWAHYADSHRGICVAFRTLPDDGFFSEAKPVIYQQSYPVLSYSPDDLSVGQKVTLLTKSEHWAYEKEWRLLNYEGYGTEKFTEHLAGVILGAEMTAEDRTNVLSWVERGDFPGWVLQARLSPNDYRLDLEFLRDRDRSFVDPVLEVERLEDQVADLAENELRTELKEAKMKSRAFRFGDRVAREMFRSADELLKSPNTESWSPGQISGRVVSLRPHWQVGRSGSLAFRDRRPTEWVGSDLSVLDEIPDSESVSDLALMVAVVEFAAESKDRADPRSWYDHVAHGCLNVMRERGFIL